MNTIVLKFGGSVLRKIENFQKIIKIVNNYKYENIIIVVSAIKGVTNNLITIIDKIFKNQPYLKDYLNLSQLHNQFIEKIKNKNLREKIKSDLNFVLNELFKNLLILVSNYKTNTIIQINDLLEKILVSGEKCSAIIINGYLQNEKIRSKILYPENLKLFTDGEYFNAKISINEKETLKIRKKIFYELSGTDSSKSKKIIIVPGFYGITRTNKINSFGRDGSDYTASILGSILKSERVEFYKDVDGICTYSPQFTLKIDKPFIKNKNYSVINKIRFVSAFKLAKYGVKIISRKALFPLKFSNIPAVFVNFDKYFMDKSYKNTIIYSFEKKYEDKYFVITTLDNVIMIEKNTINRESLIDFRKWIKNSNYEILDSTRKYYFLKLKNSLLANINSSTSLFPIKIYKTTKMISIFTNNEKINLKNLSNTIKDKFYSFNLRFQTSKYGMIMYQKQDSLHICLFFKKENLFIDDKEFFKRFLSEIININYENYLKRSV